jgi:hypothetical protein
VIGVKVNSEKFTSKMGRVISEARNPRAVMAGVGREGANQLRAHFRKKDQTDINRLAPDRREHFWRQVMNAVNAPVVSADGKTVTILINHPAIAQKIFGGDITAKRVRNLAIPEEPEAYGRSPRVFEQETGTKLIFIKQRENIFLAQAIAGGGLQVEYLLTPKVHQEPDPTALPPEDEFEAALIDRAEKILQRQLNPEASSGGTP